MTRQLPAVVVAALSMQISLIWVSILDDQTIAGLRCSLERG